MKMQRLKEIVHRFSKARVLIIGDLILDEYIWGNVDRISPEAPVPVLWANKRTFVPGGAANVANNIRALDGNVYLVGVAGKDKNSEILFSELRKRKIPVRGIFIEPQRHTTVKTRIIAGHQQVVRVDWEHTNALPISLNERILKFIEKNIKKFDAIIIEDYGKGVINIPLLEAIINLGRRYKKVITVDPKEDHFQFYHGVTSITPNRKELENAIRNLKVRDTRNRFKVHIDRLFSNKDVDVAARQVLRYLDLESILVTMGELGMQLFQRDGRVTHIPTHAQEVFDVSGAGDTVISTFTMGLCSGASKLEAAHIANYAAGIVVGKIGTATTTREELIECIGKSASDDNAR
ncbi:MAG: D-glycero-beta-D-manno-heptose-7-phosphate kinase [Candidatus Omnitrophica bacterium]|nr:D-glycero-beta-D-manno-heptose-7-phosphate kinase [Candidatus Omnitrophota bacterium]